MTDAQRRWHVVVTDGQGDTYQITDRFLIGTFHGLSREVDLAVEAWEARTGMEAESITLESHGLTAV